MTTALEAAKCLIELAAQEVDEGEPMTHLRVQKLLYYAQGWSLGLFGRSLFPESIQARKNGPLVLEVAEASQTALGDHPSRPLTTADFGSANLSGRDRVFLETIWRKYRTYSAIGLRELSQAEAPWIDARGATSDGEDSSAEITPDSLQRFFGSRPEATVVPPKALEEVYEAEAADRSGNSPGVPFEELRLRRRAGVASVRGRG